MGLKFRSMILMILGSQKLWQGGNSPLYCRGKPHTALRIHPYAQTLRGFGGGSTAMSSSESREIRLLPRAPPSQSDDQP